MSFVKRIDSIDWDFKQILLSQDALKEHAKELAMHLKVRPPVKQGPEFLRIAEIRKSINAAYRFSRRQYMIDGHSNMEWLLNNYYFVEEILEDLERGIDKSYFHNLPTVSYGDNLYIRIYYIAMAIAGHREGAVNKDCIIDFIEAYQEYTPLRMGELWALPALLKLSIARLCMSVSRQCMQDGRNEENAKKLLNEISQAEEGVVKKRIDENRGLIINEPSFAFLLRKLEDNENSRKISIYIDSILRNHGKSIEGMAQEYNRRQTRSQLLMVNSIRSLKELSSIKWVEIFERLSVVENMLRKDSVYTQMDEVSRNYYRQKVEEISKRLKVAEKVVAEEAVECSLEKESLKGHVGYYLADEGANELYERFGARKRRSIGVKSFITLIMLSATLISAGVAAYAAHFAASLAGRIIWAAVAFVLSFIPSLSVVDTLAHRLSAYFKSPRFIPKLELKQGITSDAKTLLAMPVLVNDGKKARDFAKQLEVHYLSNKSENLFFAVLGDFSAHDGEEAEQSKEVYDSAISSIDALNHKYGERFFFLQRKTVQNKETGKYEGYERKRGAVMALNNALLSGEEDGFAIAYPHIPSGIKYVITLDEDTKIYLNGAVRLVGAMEHPLNRPFLNAEGSKVVRGYGLLQPKVVSGVENGQKTRFGRIMSGFKGLDRYAFVSSDLYQDLFGEGGYMGKGIYNLEVFQKVLLERFPENSILSHDLIEGIFVRTGFVSDIEVIDSYPEKYLSWTTRQHRWARGDWQLLPFIRKTIPHASTKRVKSEINTLGRWKMAHNLWRSLLPASIFMLIFMGCIFLPGNSWLYVAMALMPIFLSSLISLFSTFSAFCDNGNMIGLWDMISDIKYTFFYALMQFIMLPYEAYLILDAAVRSIWRVYVSRKKLLQWVTAAMAEQKSNSYAKDLLKLLPQIIISVIFIAIMFITGFDLAGTLFSLAWIMGPFFMLNASLPMRKGYELPAKVQQDTLKYARRTWAYFEDFTDQWNNYLIPDNYQEIPRKGVARRTSPTNIGLGLLTNISAYNLGFISSVRLIQRMGMQIDSMQELERYNGHFYNWYDTGSKKPLRPVYVSTVDSGNLAAYLLVCSSAMKDILQLPIISPNTIKGLLVTIEIAKENGFCIDKGIEAELHEMQSLNGIDYKRLMRCLEKLEAMESSCKWETKLLRNVKELKEDITALELHNQQSQAGCLSLSELTNQGNDKAKELMGRSDEICGKLDTYFNEMDFSVLYDKSRDLFHIGIDLESGKPSPSHYDLLASEARQASFFAIAKGDIPFKHWLTLGRQLTSVDKNRMLLSWSGTMFEYLMPNIIMQSLSDTLLNETYYAAIYAQRQYAKSRGIPWGISESAYYSFDLHMNYQYKAFGVPSTGLETNLLQDLVVSPYSTMLALPLVPYGAYLNLKRLEGEGALGEYGFYESIDYTKSRLSGKKDKFVVKTYMAHHQGMSLCSIDNYINRSNLKETLHNIPMVKAWEILLKEQIPKRGVYIRKKDEQKIKVAHKSLNYKSKFVFQQQEFPKAHLMSNGEYSVMITGSGTGSSKLGDIMLNRWRKDACNDAYGIFHYIKDAKGNVWSPSYRATPSGEHSVCFENGKATFECVKNGFVTKMEVGVSPEVNAEVRRISITNPFKQDVELEVMQYIETALCSLQADNSHRAFHGLFLECGLQGDILYAKRRDKARETPVAMAITAISEDKTAAIGVQTERIKSMGRHRSIQNPLALFGSLTGQSDISAPLDAGLSYKVKIKVKAGQTSVVSFIIACEHKWEDAVKTAGEFDYITVERMFDMAWMRSQIEMRHIGMSHEDMAVFNKIASYLLHDNSSYEPWCEQDARDIWAYGISGDLPIMLISIKELSKIDSVKRLVCAHNYFKLNGIKNDLVIINEYGNDYYRPLNDKLSELINANLLHNGEGKIFLLQKETTDVALLKRTASVVLDENLKMQEKRAVSTKQRKAIYYEYDDVDIGEVGVDFDNRTGGFDGSDYVIQLNGDKTTPLPWCNIMSNENFGCIVSEGGGGYTWSDNSREFKLTPWSNDIILDYPGEAVYMRDEESGKVWSISPLPCARGGKRSIRHSKGYSEFKYGGHGIMQCMRVFVDKELPVKIYSIKLKNHTKKTRSLSSTFYCEFILGSSRSETGKHIDMQVSENGVVYAKRGGAHKIGFMSVLNSEFEHTFDRDAFLGYGFEGIPLGLKTDSIVSGRDIKDPCAAIHTKITLEPNEEKEIVFILGSAEDEAMACELKERFEETGAAGQSFNNAVAAWRKRLGKIQINTPDKAFNLIMDWLPYQTISSRLWGRTGFYQAGGAYGFRDQLQDHLGMLHIIPGKTREHIIRCCQHQFIEGDVQHWWHPPANGVRTFFSDDLLFLPYVTCVYAQTTGDESIWDEKTFYITGPAIKEGCEDCYSNAERLDIEESVYRHCERAIDKTAFGSHHLPLMGGGDWNDGMNHVGIEGKGESVWLGFFLYDVLNRFKDVAKRRGDTEREEKCIKTMRMLKEALDKSWDGAWYKRAYFDDGTPIGSSESQECSIDIISQSWSVISGVANEEEGARAIASAMSLVDEEAGVIKLLSPPFDKWKNPGYIAGYIPGVRENGGQYTHAALWLVLAAAKLSDAELAYKLFGIINPINHARTDTEALRYKAEPYVVAADVYSHPQHNGRGGWSWYTGSSSWMYKIGLKKHTGV